MSVTDPISDMFTRIRNAIQAMHDVVVMPSSKEKLSIAKILKDQGFVTKVDVSDSPKKPELKLVLANDEDGKPLIQKITRRSKPSKRIYLKKSEIPKVLNGYGICIVSTSKGIVDGKTARLNNTGGEFVGVVY